MRQPPRFDLAFHPLLSLDPERVSERFIERDYAARGKQAGRAMLRAMLCLAVLLGVMAVSGHWLDPVQEAATTQTVQG